MKKQPPKSYFTGLRGGFLCSLEFYRTAIIANMISPLEKEVSPSNDEQHIWAYLYAVLWKWSDTVSSVFTPSSRVFIKAVSVCSSLSCFAIGKAVSPSSNFTSLIYGSLKPFLFSASKYMQLCFLECPETFTGNMPSWGTSSSINLRSVFEMLPI